jgi:glycosyltransferase involved in cell wall biosynthesis
MEHKLSIIIPLFNSDKHICRCLDSILELPLHKEVIVVDDGSTDSSHSLALKYAERGDIRLSARRTRVYRKPGIWDWTTLRVIS